MFSVFAICRSGTGARRPAQGGSKYLLMQPTGKSGVPIPCALFGHTVTGMNSVFHPRQTLEKEDAGVAALKAVLSGRGTELVELAKTNLFRWSRHGGCSTSPDDSHHYR